MASRQLPKEACNSRKIPIAAAIAPVFKRFAAARRSVYSPRNSAWYSAGHS